MEAKRHLNGTSQRGEEHRFSPVSLDQRSIATMGPFDSSH